MTGSDRCWRSRSQLELAIVRYVAWFNNTRLHSALGDIRLQSSKHSTPRSAPISPTGSVAVISPRRSDALTTRRLPPRAPRTGLNSTIRRCRHPRNRSRTPAKSRYTAQAG